MFISSLKSIVVPPATDSNASALIVPLAVTLPVSVIESAINSCVEPDIIYEPDNCVDTC